VNAPTAWLNGELLPLDEARVNVLDHGLVVGDGVFETLRLYGGVPFAWRRHYARLRASADGLGLPLPDEDLIRSAADAVVRANGIEEGRLRVTVTGGTAPPGSHRPDVPPTAFVVASPLDPPAPTASVVVVPWSRNERGATAGLKTISYAENVRALAFAETRGGNEAIFANTRAHLCEATGSNVFVVHDRTVLTPPESAGCLAGVTRALLLELCREFGIDAHERDLTIDEFRDAGEAFLSSTTREVQAIGTIDGVELRDAPGPTTSKLAAAFRELVKRDLDP
jgi:branched-chain amino acid aminotransferase